MRWYTLKASTGPRRKTTASSAITSRYAWLMPRALDRSEKCRSLSLRLSQTCQLSDPWAVTTEDASKAMRVRIRVCDDFMATPFIYHSGIVPVVRVCTILANRYSSYLKKALQQPPALPRSRPCPGYSIDQCPMDGSPAVVSCLCSAIICSFPKNDEGPRNARQYLEQAYRRSFRAGTERAVAGQLCVYLHPQSQESRFGAQLHPGQQAFGRCHACRDSA